MLKFKTVILMVNILFLLSSNGFSGTLRVPIGQKGAYESIKEEILGSNRSNESFFKRVVQDAVTIKDLVESPDSNFSISEKGYLQHKWCSGVFYLTLKDKVLFEDDNLLVVADMPENDKDRIVLGFYTPEIRDNFLLVFLTPSFEIEETSNSFIKEIIDMRLKERSVFELHSELDNIYKEASRRIASFLSPFRNNGFIDYVWNSLNLPEINEKYRLIGERERRKAVLKKINKIIVETRKMRSEKPLTSLTFQDTDVITVGQKQMAASKYEPNDDLLPRYLQSVGAGHCVICVFYHQPSKKGAMIHIDGTTNQIDSIRSLVRLLSVPFDEIRVRLFGGNDIDFILRIFDTFVQFKGLVISEVEMNYIFDIFESKKIILDLADGVVYNITMESIQGMSISESDRISPGPAYLLPLGLAHPSLKSRWPNNKRIIDTQI